jgi:RNA polymerase sigma-70 factor, ECF subfamily
MGRRLLATFPDPGTVRTLGPGWASQRSDAGRDGEGGAQMTSAEALADDVQEAGDTPGGRWRHEAFTALVERHDRALRSLAYRLLGADRERMDDVLQEAYAKAYRSLPSFRGDSKPHTWLYRIVYNACLDDLRRRSRRLVPLALDAVADRPVAGPDPGDRIALRRRLAAALAELPPDQRAAVLLVDVEGFDYAAAADVLGVPAGTVGSRLSRARAALRQALVSPDA